MIRLLVFSADLKKTGIAMLMSSSSNLASRQSKYTTFLLFFIKIGRVFFLQKLLRKTWKIVFLSEIQISVYCAKIKEISLLLIVSNGAFIFNCC